MTQLIRKMQTRKAQTRHALRDVEINETVEYAYRLPLEVKPSYLYECLDEFVTMVKRGADTDFVSVSSIKDIDCLSSHIGGDVVRRIYDDMGGLVKTERLTDLDIERLAEYCND